MLALHVLWVGRIVAGAPEYTIRESRDPPCHETVNVIRNCSNGDGFIPAQQAPLQPVFTTEIDHPRVLIRLAKLEPEIRKPHLQLFRQPRTCGKTTHKESSLSVVSRGWCPKGIRVDGLNW